MCFKLMTVIILQIFLISLITFHISAPLQKCLKKKKKVFSRISDLGFGIFIYFSLVLMKCS